MRVHVGGRAVFDCVLLGSPRPKVLPTGVGQEVVGVFQVCWLFNEEKMKFTDIIVEDTSDVCRLTIPYVQPYHFGMFPTPLIPFELPFRRVHCPLRK